MKEANKRWIFRWIHIVFSIPILGYIYSPFEKLPGYAPATRFVFLLPWSFPDCGCGRAMLLGGFFQKNWHSDLPAATFVMYEHDSYIITFVPLSP